MITEKQSIKNKIYSLKRKPLTGNFTCECGFNITGEKITEELVTDGIMGVKLIAVKFQNIYRYTYYIPCYCKNKGRPLSSYKSDSLKMQELYKADFNDSTPETEQAVIDFRKVMKARHPSLNLAGVQNFKELL